MSSSPRHLQFAVGTTLLGASLSLGCAGKTQPNDEPPHVNTAPVDPPTNTAPIADPDETPSDAPVDAPPSETPPADAPPDDAKAPDATVNVRNVEPERAPEPKRVNTRPDDV